MNSNRFEFSAARFQSQASCPENHGIPPLSALLSAPQSHARPYAKPKMPRFRWSLENHESFTNAVKQLGGEDRATPKMILELMNVKNVTLAHVKSHLQMYRSMKQEEELMKAGAADAETACKKYKTMRSLSQPKATSDHHDNMKPKPSNSLPDQKKYIIMGLPSFVPPRMGPFTVGTQSFAPPPVGPFYGLRSSKDVIAVETQRPDLKLKLSTGFDHEAIGPLPFSGFRSSKDVVITAETLRPPDLKLTLSTGSDIEAVGPQSLVFKNKKKKDKQVIVEGMEGGTYHGSMISRDHQYKCACSNHPARIFFEPKATMGQSSSSTMASNDVSLELTLGFK